MPAPFSWIRPEPHGIHVVPANCWIDPSQPVSNALVTHGHADHARGGHGRTVATPETLAIMELRYQTRDGALPVAYGETLTLPGGVSATFVPAGHVLGSAQIVLEHAGEFIPDRCGLEYVGRAASPSPATGNAGVHKKELERLLGEAFGDRATGERRPGG